MTAEDLMGRIIAHGADAQGIRDRFADNAELYQACFEDFLGEANFAALDEAIGAKDYDRAFDAAHALKGLSGNLGLTAFYGAIRVLVESLRAKRYQDVAAQYALVIGRYDALKALYGGGQPPRATPEDSAASEDSARPDARAHVRRDGFLRGALAAILGILVLVGFMFCRVTVNYRRNIVTESSQHLIEMSNQIRMYVEEEIANDWRIARSVGASIINGGYADDDRKIIDMLKSMRAVWKVSGLMLYTENGACVYSDGRAVSNDEASQTIVQAWQQGQYLSIVDSKITYTVPLETPLKYRDCAVCAVSVVRDMSTFLDDMSFSSFDGAAWMYLAEDNGIVISILTNDAAVPAFNFKSVVKDMDIVPLVGAGSADEYISARAPAAFLMSDATQKNYVVSVPISTGDMPLRLFYLAPEAVVNRTMNGFSRQLTIFSMATICLFGAFASLAFLFLYKGRKALFDRALMARERMFDLLIQNTRTAFALLGANRKEPDYVSSNTRSVVGDRYWIIDRDASGYRMRNSENTDTAAIRQANEMLRGWDGKSAFKSGYIRNDQAAAPYYFEYQLYPIDGAGCDFVGIAQDVTQAYAREEATRGAMEMALRSNEAKSRFLSNMSHDIRTPMNVIVNMTAFALDALDQPQTLERCLHTVQESSEHLLHIINDVLDMSRIESGQTAVASAPFDLAALLRRQADMARPLCAAKGQTLITDFHGVRAQTVCADALKVSQILVNLLSNAVKFTPENGVVRFAATQIPSLRDDMVDVRFTVEDNGIGIPQAEIAHIFDPFHRANDSRVAKIEGTGLGLSICKSYVEAMGGVIRCQSREGEGSMFTVELFFREGGAAVKEKIAPAPQGNTPFQGMRCLVVEDNATNQLIAKTLLERLGFSVDLAGDGREGVDAFLKAPPDAYDVVYMDIRMPVLDGYQATAQIRASGHPRAQSIPIVAMTANVFAEDIEKARVAAMDAFVAKPVVSSDLIEQTDKAIDKHRGWQL